MVCACYASNEVSVNRKIVVHANLGINVISISKATKAKRAGVWLEQYHVYLAMVRP
jgi:hypothetical protein